MKICPVCKTTYNDAMRFCTKDGTPLANFEQKPETSFAPPVPIEENLAPPSNAQVNSDLDKTSDPSSGYLAVPSTVSSIPSTPTVSEKPPPQGVIRNANPPTARKNNKSLLVVLGVLIGLGLIGAVGAGLWWFGQSRATEEVAVADSNSNSAPTPDLDNQNLSNNTNETLSSNIDANANVNSESAFNSNVNTETNSNVNLKPSPKPTPSPSPTPFDRNANRNANRTLEINRAAINTSTPLPRPTPQSTPNQAERRTIVTSGGVVNGKATSLPKPAYPSIARTARAAGQVQVVVLINESGNVESARAVSGSPLLRQAAESAARQAKFSPTVLSGQPVKVSGVIIYNFVL
jgi:TonB family protein